MQYLLTEEEYNTLHGEGEDELIDVEKQNIALRSQLDSIINAVGMAHVHSYDKPQELHEKYVAVEFMVRTLPEPLRKIIELKTKTH